ncbi:CoA transferase [Aquihabitans sp. G128]|uniref:CaiB/BaiF CoA-transferase family protein n=1 Tax=Aquihabitans sp. G128 TaxID=2849779 RepID=UPI001C239D06|nr:CoA transferase [Aquihabitans sp. G128]QXC61642.1 CoA transferase [Aquihabitans sp. G128]
MTEAAALRVLDTTSGIAGAYAALLLVHAGADVVRVEPSGGDPLRRWAQADVPETEAGALHEYLRQGQRAIGVDGDPFGAGVLDGVDVLLASPAPADDAALRAAVARDPGLVAVAFTPYGLDGPYRDRPATDLTLQADSGALAIRGHASRRPFQMGGRTTEWLAGAYAAAGALAFVEGRHRGRGGALLDLSLAEVANIGGANFMDVFHAVQSGPGTEPQGPPRTLETPSIERTADGWVGFNTNAPHQITAFLRMIGRDDLADSGELTMAAQRVARIDEWQALVTAWTSQRTTAEVVALAVAHKVPVAPVCDGRSVAQLDTVVDRGSLVDAPSGRFRMPGRPWRIDGQVGPAPRPAPSPPAAPVASPTWPGGRTAWPPPPAEADAAPGRPLAGLRVLDLTTWWAGPMSSGLLAALGADVVHLEAPARMDGARMVGASFFDRPSWWELSPFFLTVNAGKRSLALDLEADAGRALALRLVAEADVLIENATPRVLPKLGLGGDAVHAANPRTIVVRMPAFGLDGPWSERPGFAQTIEQASGLAWMTGEHDDQPRIQRGPCDPNGGLHAAIGLLVALRERERTGEGSVVEAAMFDAALAVAAEPIIEWSAYGNLTARDGNRSPWAAPQGLYACAGPDRWLAASVDTDERWLALCRAIDRPDLAADPSLADLAGRRAQHDRLDDALGTWAAGRDLDEAVGLLVAAAVPAAPARDPRATAAHPQFRARGFHEPVDHPVAGVLPTPSLPFRVAGVERWLRTPAPTFGQHNREVLAELAGASDDELAALAEQHLIADRPTGL